DLFPKHKLPRAIAFLNFGFYAGSGVALIIGGTVTQMFSNMPPTALPVIGTVRGWQLTFFIVGIPGLIVAALMRTVREPKRRGLVKSTHSSVRLDSSKPLPVLKVLGFMIENGATYLPLFLGMGIQTVLLFGIASWGPAFYIRTYGWTPGRFGLVQGLLSLTIMPLGAVVGSMLAERFARNGHDDANMRLVVLSSLVALPGSILFPLMPTATLAIIVSAYS